MGTPTSSRKRHLTDQLVICDQCDNPVDQCLSLDSDDDVDGQSFQEEAIALADPRLKPFFESQLHCDDALELNVAHYCLYDTNHHLVSIDSGLIESDKCVYLKGYLKPLTDTDDDPTEDSIPAHDVGPIEQWWISGFDGGERVLIGIESPLCRYNLLSPHPRYKMICESIGDKILLTKYIIEWIECNPQSNCSQLLQHLTIKYQKLKLSRLYQILPFILDQIQSYDEAASPEDLKLFETLAIQELIESASRRSLKLKRPKSITRQTNEPESNRNIIRIDSRGSINSNSYATCTQLVATFFEEQFKGALNPRQNEIKPTSIYKQLGHRGYGKLKRDLMSVKIHWTSEVKHEDSFSKRKYYDSARINGLEISSGNFVTIARNQRNAAEDNSGIGRVIDLFEVIDGQKYAHVDFLCFSESTILEETGSLNSVYFVQECGDISLNKLIDKIDVDLGLDISSEKRDFHCDRIYSKDYGWFRCFNRQIVDLLEAKSCLGCYSQEQRRKFNQILLPKSYIDQDDLLYYKKITIKGHDFQEGSFALINPDSVDLPDYLLREMRANQTEIDCGQYDENLYPERYRKQFTEFVKGGLDDVNKTFSVVRIKSIFRIKNDPNDDCQLKVQLLYQAQNCFEEYDQLLSATPDEVYLTDDVRTIHCSALHEPCDVYYLENDDHRPDNRLIPGRYFVTSFYNHSNRTFESIPRTELSSFSSSDHRSSIPVQPLKTLDLFSGCGGLASGFKESGASETLWAIEKDSSAAKSFSHNFPSSIVFNDDANRLLARLLAGEKFATDDETQRLPQPGEVEMILGGPPCQGFSGMNRFSNRLYSVFKNSLLVTFLSYIDYYRPNVVVFENVRNFVQFERSKILKLTLSCLLTMNYQVTFGVLQAGSYGVPQSRRRTFILATHPTFELPDLPKPFHCFSARACQLDVVIGNKRSKPIHNQVNCYFRPYTVADAINDLPDEAGNSLAHLSPYQSTKTFYQKLMRQGIGNELEVALHVVPTMSLLNQARIDRIPCLPGADWRDLPNIRLILKDGTVIEKLEYLYDDTKNGKSSSGSLRGVCDCASGKPCSKSTSRPENTLIPWGLVHTANRNYQWSGLFGRLQWNGFFITTITKTIPSSKQGSVLHPQANRVISIRESARSQGFPDNYHFHGSISDIKVQIGNAVPIPLARSIGLEVIKSLDTKIMTN